jgi:hypothetical protein
MSAFILHDRYIDPEAGRVSSLSCQFFILIGQDSLQYCLLDPEKNTFIALADYRLPDIPKTREAFYTQVGQLITGEEMFRNNYASVVTGIDTPWHTLVPSALYDAGHLEKYLGFNFRLPEGCRVVSDKIEELDAFNIFGYLPGPGELIRERFPGAALVHPSTALVRAVYRHHQVNPDAARIFLNSRKDTIDLVAFNGNRLAFFNSFSARSREDVLYFTLYAIDQLRLRPDAVQLILAGNMDPGSETCLLLEEYIGTVSFASRPDLFAYSPLFDNLPGHHYQDLFAMALCGS